MPPPALRTRHPRPIHTLARPSQGVYLLTWILGFLIAVALILVLGMWRGASGQLIPVRTVPVASGDQFLLLPSSRLGMGGISLAVDDPLADPWVNPAMGSATQEPSFFAAPTYYGIGSEGGAGRSLPLGGIARTGPWFGGATLALQQIEDGGGDFVTVLPLIDWIGPPRRLDEASSRNLYGGAFLGRTVGSGGWAVGFGASGARIEAMDGVDLLYAGADRIDQSGTLADLRVGVHHRGDRDQLSVVLAHHRVSMKHEVDYVDWVWDEPATRPLFQRRTEINEDRSRTWGGSVAWDRSLRAPGWRMGMSGTVNRKSHPKIPNYDIQNIPRDPGQTWAYEAGFGLARSRDGSTFGVDVLLQPIWSNTWQEADSVTPTPSGRTLQPGERTIENDFFFTNVLLRMGFAQQIRAVEIQGGLEVRSYDYGLKQRNHLTAGFRRQDESWMEWTPTVGASVRFSDLELRYLGRLTTGTGRPGTEWDPSRAAVAEAVADFIVAPQAPLTLQSTSVATHQLAISVPIR